MKTILTITLFILFTGAYSQNYHPIVYEYSGWNNVGWILQNNPTPIAADLYKCYFQDDTIINDQAYHKYYFDRTYHYIPTMNTIYTEDSNVYIGAMRNENKKYYFIPNDSTNEKLIYDFELDINDSVPIGFKPYPAFREIIYDTSHRVLFDGSKRKIYNTKIQNYAGDIIGYSTYFESLGNYNSLVHPDLFTVQNYDGGFEMFTYCENGQLLYDQPNLGWLPGENCSFPVITVENGTTPELIIKPNPTSGNNITIQLVTTQSGSEEYDLILLNNYGQIVHRESKYTSSNNQISLSLNIPKGLYILCLTYDHKTIMKKIIKI